MYRRTVTRSHPFGSGTELQRAEDVTSGFVAQRRGLRLAGGGWSLASPSADTAAAAPARQAAELAVSAAARHPAWQGFVFGAGDAPG
jgi:hypothetical protein